MGGVFLYDGDSGFCTTSAGWLQRHATSPARVVAWQHADVMSFGLRVSDCAEAVQWVDDGHRAVGLDALAAYCNRVPVLGERSVESSRPLAYGGSPPARPSLARSPPKPAARRDTRYGAPTRHSTDQGHPPTKEQRSRSLCAAAPSGLLRRAVPGALARSAARLAQRRGRHRGLGRRASRRDPGPYRALQGGVGPLFGLAVERVDGTSAV